MMAAKLFEPLKDERKQIGCMTGFIHIFEPTHTHLQECITHSMTLQGSNSQFFRGNREVEETRDPYQQHGLVMRKDRTSNDGLGLYTESSRASCSSSQSSSFSSVDYSKVMQPEPCSYDRIIFPESPLIDRSLSHSSTSWRMRQRSFDLDDAVKDLPCTAGAESMLMKHQDSPRSLQAMKVSLANLNALGSPRPPLKFNDSLCYGERKASRLLDNSKGNQYERIELGCYSHDTKERKENYDTPDEVARLSVDSSTESSVLVSRMRTVHHNQRPPSIVEKLMGLDAMPGASCIMPNSNNRFVKIGERQDNLIHKSASPVSKCMPIQVSSLQRYSRKGHKWKNGELVMKPISSSRILVEPAPWKQPEVNRTSQKAAVQTKHCSASCESNAFTALYSKFEGRLKDAEFQRSSEDLKTLKQMLNAVQQNGSWKVENKVLSTGATINNNPYLNLDMTLKETQRQIHQNVCTSAVNGEQESFAKALKSPIVVMKPFRLVAKSDIAASSVIRSEGVTHLSKPQGGDSASRRRSLSSSQAVKGPNQRNGYQTPQINPSEKKVIRRQSTMPQPVAKEKKMNSAVSLGSASPKMQQKKFEFQKKPRPATTSGDATKLSVPKSKHPTKSYPSGERSQTKYSVTVTQLCNAQPSGFSVESKDTFCGDDTEVTSKLRLDPIDGSRSPARKVARPTFSGIRKHKPSRISTEDTPLADPTTTAAEQPSPVSVLDSVAFKDDPPSPLIRKMASCKTAELVTRMSREKLKQIEDLVHKLNRVSSTFDKSNTDFMASLCKTTNPDLRYISKVLLASGFLFLDFESNGNSIFQPHISGHPINPELFFVLEQTKSAALLTEDRNRLSASKSHRRLIFDSCNEILAEQLVPSSMSNDTLSMPRKLARRNISSQRLLNDMCDRIEQMQAKSSQRCKLEQQEEGHEHDEDDGLKKIVYEDMMLKSDKWGNSEECMAEVVLDIERMLFKDLVKEIVSDEAVSFGLRAKAGRSCDRKLHFNML